MKSGGPLRRKTELKPGGPLKSGGPLNRSGRLNPVSDKQRNQWATQKEAYATADDAGAEWCSVCGRAGAVEHSHLYSQHLHEQHRNNPLNWLQCCRGCHNEYENKRPLFAKKWPAVWAEIIRRMQVIDPKAYDFYSAKTPELYPD